MINVKLVIQYDGTRYDGWQRLGGDEDRRTIQGTLEEQLSELLSEEIRIVGSGRTDRGVHAMGQVANFTVKNRVICDDFIGKLNLILPEDIKILEVQKVKNNFHSRHNAKGKTYVYYIDNGTLQSIFYRKYTGRIGENLDIEKMREAAQYLIGSHDFVSFSSPMNDGRTTVKNITELTIDERSDLPFFSNRSSKRDEKIIAVTISGNGFLYNMVRILVGTLVEVGRGNKKPEDMIEVLEKKERRLSGFLIEPQGLFLEKVYYN